MNDTFEEVLDIINTLNEKELNYICNDKFIDSPYLVYRKIRNGSFIEIYNYNKEVKDEHPIIGNNILVVSSPNSRRKGNADYLLKLALKECPGSFFVYETDVNNKASINLAIKNGFKLYKKIDGVLYYIYKKDKKCE